MKRLIERMAAIERMERGKLCRMTGRPHYNHQTWHNGRNEVRYVPADAVDALQKASKDISCSSPWPSNMQTRQSD